LIKRCDGVGTRGTLMTLESAPNRYPAAKKDDQSGERRNLGLRTFERAQKYGD